MVVEWGEVQDYQQETKENRFISNILIFKDECIYVLFQYVDINLKKKKTFI